MVYGRTLKAGRAVRWQVTRGSWNDGGTAQVCVMCECDQLQGVQRQGGSASIGLRCTRTTCRDPPCSHPLRASLQGGGVRAEVNLGDLGDARSARSI